MRKLYSSRKKCFTFFYVLYFFDKIRGLFLTYMIVKINMVSRKIFFFIPKTFQEKLWSWQRSIKKIKFVYVEKNQICSSKIFSIFKFKLILINITKHQNIYGSCNKIKKPTMLVKYFHKFQIYS